MKKQLLCILSSLTILPTILSAIVIQGDTDIANQMYSDLTVHGRATLTHVSVMGDARIDGDARLGQGVLVQGKLIVNGSLTATEANFHYLEVNGSARLNSCNIQNPITLLKVKGACNLNNSSVLNAEIHGYLSAERSSLNGMIQVYGRTVSLRDCNLNNLYMKQTPHNQHQIVDLINTRVIGNISFDDRLGTVYSRKNSHINGQVIGGVIKEASPDDSTLFDSPQPY